MNTCLRSSIPLRRLKAFTLLAAAAALASAGSSATARASASSSDEEESTLSTTTQAGHYSVSLMSSFRTIGGSFDAYGNYTPYPAGASAWSLMNTLTASYRFSSMFEASMSLPMRDSQVQVSSGSSSSLGVGGPSMQGRMHLGGWANVVIHVGVGIPLSANSQQVVGDPSIGLPANLGDGSSSGPSLSGGVGVSHSFGRFRFNFDVSTIYGFNWASNMSEAPPGTPQTYSQAGERFQMAETTGYLLSPRWSLNLGFRQGWQLDTISNSFDVPGTANRLYTTSAGVTFNATHHWRFSGSFDSPFPFYQWETYQAYAPSVALSISFSGSLFERQHDAEYAQAR